MKLNKNAAKAGGIFHALKRYFLLAFLILALLISDAAAGLASRLAGSLAFAASAVLCAVTQISGFKSLDVFHCVEPPQIYDLI